MQQSFATLPTINKLATGSRFSAPILRLTFATPKPLFSGPLVDVAKLTLCGTAPRGPAHNAVSAPAWYDAVTMCSEPPSIGLVFATALRLAQRSGKSEISVEILLAALDHHFTPNEVAGPTTGLFLPIPREDMPLSKEVQTAIAAIAPLGDIFSIPTSLLRSALLAAAP